MDLASFRAWLTEYGIEGSAYQNAVEIFLIVLATATASFIAKRVLKRIEAQFLKTKNLWDDSLLHAARKPISLAIWIVGLSLAAYVSSDASDTGVREIITAVQKIGIIACFTWFVVGFISGAEKLLVNPERMSEPMDETTVSAIGKLVRASVVITSVLVGLQTMGYSISGVLAFGGIGGIAVGFCRQRPSR